MRGTFCCVSNESGDSILTKKIFYEDKKYKEFINKIRYLTDDKEKFIEYELELLDSLS